MSENKMATKEDLKEFYNRIYPYLGGSAAAGFTPVGTVIAVMSNHAPANYLICDGTVYNIADYPELANHFLNEFGSKNYFGGNGTTTFATPNLSGEFLRGTGTNSHSGNGNGATVGTHQDSTKIPRVWSGGATAIIPKDVAPTNVDNYSAQGSACYLISTSENNGYYEYFTSRPTNTSVLFCIATKNIYLNPSLDYSTDEKVVGTWIDGKTIYQKTFTGELTTYNDNNDRRIFLVDDILTSIDNCISFDGFYHVVTASGSMQGRKCPLEGANVGSALTADGGSTYLLANGNLTVQVRLALAWGVTKMGYAVTFQYTKA